MALYTAIAVILCGMTAGCSEDDSINALTINDIRFDPLSFTGEIALTGISAGLYQNNPSIFFLMDTEELLVCKNFECGAFQLPVLYTGSGLMPELADELVITGSWGVYEEGGRDITVFEAASIDVLRNTMDIIMP
jgi:hypothetical protein